MELTCHHSNSLPHGGVKIKHKARVIPNMCCGAFVNGWVLIMSNLLETRTLFLIFFRPSLCFQWFNCFSPDQPTLIFGRFYVKKSIKKTMEKYNPDHSKLKGCRHLRYNNTLDSVI